MKRNTTIIEDFKSNIWIILILCVGMIPVWFNGYCGYILILLFPVLLNFRLYDKWSIIIIAFSFIYTLAQLVQTQLGPALTIIYILFPIILYQSGIYIYKRNHNFKSCIILLCLMAVFMAIPAILTNINDFISSGEIVNMSRRMTYDNTAFFMGATIYGIMLSLICGLFGIILIKTKTVQDTYLKIILFLFSIVALFCTIHLVNRTGIALAMASVFIATVTPPVKLKNIFYTSIILIIFLFLYLYFANNIELINIIDSYINRDQGGGDVSSFGGRDERWMMALNQIFDQPFGNPNGLRFGISNYNYAHNIILDSGIKGGILCFILMFAIFVKLIMNLFKIWKNKYITRFYKYILLTIGITLFLQCMVEPIIEASYQYLSYLFFYIGLSSQASRIKKKSTHTKNISKISSLIEN